MHDFKRLNFHTTSEAWNSHIVLHFHSYHVVIVIIDLIEYPLLLSIFLFDACAFVHHRWPLCHFMYCYFVKRSERKSSGNSLDAHKMHLRKYTHTHTSTSCLDKNVSIFAILLDWIRTLFDSTTREKNDCKRKRKSEHDVTRQLCIKSGCEKKCAKFDCTVCVCRLKPYNYKL